jgi:hypothetical protein
MLEDAYKKIDYKGYPKKITICNATPIKISYYIYNENTKNIEEYPQY